MSTPVQTITTTKSTRKGKEEGNSADSIKVICRFRPQAQSLVSRRESSRAPGRPSDNNAKIDSFKLFEERAEIEYVSDFSDNKFFKFDRVFGGESTQIEVFNEVSGVVQSVMAGFNGTVMAYGQTSAGKSWTMEGSSIWDNDSQGIIPRCIDNLFDEINNSDPEIQFQVTISFFEIYCEKVRDLLNPSAFNLKIRETKTQGFVIQDVTEIACTDRESVLRVIELGKTNRASAPTLMNAESSRSHSIVSVMVDQRNLTTGRNKSGRLFMVDLAGSEKVGKTGATGVRLEEAKNINSSLTTLGMVINALCDHSPHIPYRDSKLTMILMDALGGNSKTTLIICCNPELKHTPETVTTLRFGERAKRIKNNAKINEELSAEELKVLLAAARKEILLLKKKLQLGPNSSTQSMSSLAGSLIPTGLLAASLDGGVDDELIAIERLQTDNAASFHLSKADFTENDELLSLNAKIVSLEEEMEVEKIRYKEEHENSLLHVSECEALRSSILELEAKLLKVSLDSKRHLSTASDRHLSSASTEGNLSPSAATLNDNNLQRKASMSMDNSSSQDPSSNKPIPLTKGRPLAASDLTINTGHIRLEPEGAYKSEGTADGTVDEYGNAMLGDDDVMLGDNEESELDPDVIKSQELAADMLKLNEHSVQLRNALENEIKGLERNMSLHQIDTQQAHATAQSYAEKYIRLREEYESHVQRLMFKLTQEQQARTHVEDRLEDALHRLWRQSGNAASRPKGFFSSLFGSVSSTFNGAASNDRMSISGGHPGDKQRSMSISQGSGNKNTPSSGMTMSDRELNISRSLELSQYKVSQLAAELEANKEAQSIVLETKESVMRSLARQNSQLTIERDALSKRSEDLSQTVDQLTNLLRSVQSRKVAATPSATPRNMSFIQGGGLKRGNSMAASKFNFNVSSLDVSGIASHGSHPMREMSPIEGIREEPSPVEKDLSGKGKFTF